MIERVPSVQHCLRIARKNLGYLASQTKTNRIKHHFNVYNRLITEDLVFICYVSLEASEDQRADNKDTLETNITSHPEKQSSNRDLQCQNKDTALKKSDNNPYEIRAS